MFPLQDDIEKVMEEQERLKAQVGKLNSRSKELRSQNEKLEAMVGTIVTCIYGHLFIKMSFIYAAS